MEVQALQEMDPFQRLPNEMQRAVLSHLPFNSILKVRLVSSHWKDMISRNYSHKFTCELTDESYPYVLNSTDIFPTVKIFDLTVNKALSSTRGTGWILSNAKKLKLVGVDIDLNPLKKMMHYAARNSRELLFEGCSVPILKTVMELSVATDRFYFQNLTKLSIQFIGPTNAEQTRFLNKLATKSSFLKALYHLSLIWCFPTTAAFCRAQLDQSDRARKIFEGYLASARLITCVRGTLKSLEIGRSPLVVRYSNIEDSNFVVDDEGQRGQINKYTAELRELKLTVLKLSLLMMEGRYPFILENALLRSQSSVKKAIITKNCYHSLSVIPQTLQNLLPLNVTHLTTVNICMSIQTRDPISFGYFAQCPHLKNLRLSTHARPTEVEEIEDATCSVSELDQLPRTLQNLYLVPPRTYPNGCEYDDGGDVPFRMYEITQLVLILTRNQVEWITKNLLNLKSFGCFLFSTDQQQPQRVNAGQNHIHARLPIPNVDFGLFKTLVEMPKLKTLEFNMVTIGQIHEIILYDADEIPPSVISTSGIAQYIDHCTRHGEVTSLKTTVIPTKYIEMTIEKK